MLVEKRFNISCSSISPWRRAIVGDMTSAFNFESPDYTWPKLPETKNYTEESVDQCLHLPYPMVPIDQSLPKQESGVRISRALPYQFRTEDVVNFATNSFELIIDNIGQTGAPFIFYDLFHLGVDAAVRHYTVESQKSIESILPIECDDGASCQYHFHLLGPNGYFRQFFGSSECPLYSAKLSYLVADGAVLLTIVNAAADTTEFSIVDNAYWADPVSISLSPDEIRELQWNVTSSGNWYDITISSSDCFRRRFGGRMENGLDSISDPAMGSGVPDIGFLAPVNHPPVPINYRILSRTDNYAREQRADHKDAMIYWEEMEDQFIG